MRKLLFILCIMLLVPTSALAASDVIATYKYSDGNMVTLCTRDAEHVRMDTSATSYMLLKDGKLYSVSRDDEGKWHAMDMSQMGGGSGGFMSMFGGGEEPKDYDVRYEKTGKSEKIAGYQGTVYNAVVFEDGKVITREEIVLGTHSNLKKLTEGWLAVASGMKNMNQSFDDSIEEAKKMGYGGVLRYGNDMRLSKLQVKNLDSAYYALPSGAQHVQLPQSTQQSSSGDAGLSDDAKEVGMDAKDATKDEIKSGVRGVISDIFN